MLSIAAIDQHDRDAFSRFGAQGRVDQSVDTAVYAEVDEVAVAHGRGKDIFGIDHRVRCRCASGQNGKDEQDCPERFKVFHSGSPFMAWIMCH